MAISPIQAADVLRMANGSETSGAASNQEVEAFMQHLLAGGSAVPEHAVVNHLQQAQQTLISGLRDTSLLKQLSLKTRCWHSSNWRAASWVWMWLPKSQVLSPWP
ncbi:hypothetical protein QNH14_12550 [Apirhabdus apintestini]|nr:hypothetical protein QNH14_12550 [Enterobacteriaceae bacterium CA-0114]